LHDGIAQYAGISGVRKPTEGKSCLGYNPNASPMRMLVPLKLSIPRMGA
jgi:hypothetical protein